MNKVNKVFQQEIQNLQDLADEDINTSDIPEITQWEGAKVGQFYKPIKKQITLRLDADTLDWFKTHNLKYQTQINVVLREYMEQQKKAI